MTPSFRLMAILLLILTGLWSCAYQSTYKPAVYDYSEMNFQTKRVHKKTEHVLKQIITDGIPSPIPPRTRIDSVCVNNSEKTINIHFNPFLATIPFRSQTVEETYDIFKKNLGGRYQDYELTLFSESQPIEQLVPNLYRDKKNIDASRNSKPQTEEIQLVQNMDFPVDITRGLSGKHIALWHSHGWYYSNQSERWEWQRPRLFQTVEDVLPMAFTLPYIVPMLENSGANVFIPRERDWQINEVIVDNDSSTGASIYSQKQASDSTVIGFGIGNPPYESGETPFTCGSSETFVSSTEKNSSIEWIPDIPETGEYAVYVTYVQSDSNTAHAQYTVYHYGGSTNFKVNQKIGGQTWVYLGKFKFNQGLLPEKQKIVLSLSAPDNGNISADCVRFGGGMGNVARNGKTSGRPRYLEAARYYLQYSGIHDTLVYNLNNDTLDYVDDYRSRGEWVNYLKGAPFGPNRNRNYKGLGIPVDLSFSFHTDAGIQRDSSVVGTLSIYSVEDYDSAFVFPDSVSRWANRDLADIVQTEIVSAIQNKYYPKWNRRALYNRKYSEAYMPNVPAMLLELLSHQNFNDMLFALEPEFRFDVSRAIYKGMTKFLASQQNSDYVIQPLPVTHFCLDFVDSGQVLLNWKPTIDSLEPTATPENYILYTRIGDKGFDNGQVVNADSIIISGLVPKTIYSYKICAANAGGISFPSEILSVCIGDSLKEPVLIINGFDRVAAPEIIHMPRYAGFADYLDQGVPDGYDLSYTGEQISYFPYDRFITNDNPGWGRSHADMETKIIAGNTHDFTVIHGKAILASGHSFISVSDESIEDSMIDINKYKYLDLYFGEEKTTQVTHLYNTAEEKYQIYTSEMQQKLSEYCNRGGNLFISGSYIGSDLLGKNKDSTAYNFASDVLKYRLNTSHASKTGIVGDCHSSFSISPYLLKFSVERNPKIYNVEAPNSIIPVNDSTGTTILRYQENRFSAATAYSGKYKVINFAFPFETIISEEMRNRAMAEIFAYFHKIGTTFCEENKEKISTP